MIVPKFEHAEVIVIGDIMLDRYWYGETNRISPEAPVPIVNIDFIEDKPGGAANVAMNIASLGANSSLIGFTGVDETSRILSQILTDFNVKCDFISLPAYSTITKLRIFSRNQQLIRLDFEGKIQNVNSEPLYKRINQISSNTGVLVFSDYNKGTLNNIQKMIRLALKSKIPILVDPKGNNFECYRGATLLTPNFSEFEELVGKCKNENEIIERGMKLIVNMELSSLLITRDECGMILLQSNKAPIHIPNQAKEINDVTGAGDTVIGVLAATLAAGYTLEEACYFANLAAGIVVSKLGVSYVSLIELENAIHLYSKD